MYIYPGFTTLDQCDTSANQLGQWQFTVFCHKLCMWFQEVNYCRKISNSDWNCLISEIHRFQILEGFYLHKMRKNKFLSLQKSSSLWKIPVFRGSSFGRLKNVINFIVWSLLMALKIFEKKITKLLKILWT